jgi:hypothetical protein
MDNGMARATAEMDAPDAAAETTGRALVPITAPAESVNLSHRNLRPDASFVIHLIATAEHAPQTRTLRRATADTAVATYNGAVTRERTTAMPVSRLALSRMI